jgi:DNA-binding NtrC family response regulator
MQEGTVPIEESGRLVRTLRLEVLTGPDAGKSLTSDSDSVTVGSADGNDLMLSDKTVSRFHLELRRQRGRIVAVDHGSTNGTRAGSVVLHSTAAALDAGTVLQLGATSLKVADGDLVDVGEAPHVLGDLLGDSLPMRRLMASAARVAKTDVAVLLLGESGTGKELIARALHDASPRAAEPFVTVDCGAITPTLFASELFGHERGAFTSADRQHIGAFERATGGTLFLDEVGELPLELQAALLGALERKSIRRVGGREDVDVDVRLVSATHRDLRAQVNAGTFRLDLFYRIAVVTLGVPPLRERPDDIPLLVEHFLSEAGHAGSVASVFPSDAMKLLRAHSWPGNVRELRNVVLGTLALGEQPNLGTGAAEGPQAGADPFARVLGLSYREAKRRVMDDFERRYVENLLDGTGGNVRQAARDGQMDRSYLMELVKRHGLKGRG